MKLPRVRVPDAETSKALTQLAGAIESGLLDYVGTMNIVTQKLTTSDVNVFHGLKRVPRGWIVVGLNANAVVYAPTAATSPATYLPIRASAACTAQLLFF